MRLTSTRGHGPVDFRTALFAGLAPDGGLYQPPPPPAGAMPPGDGSSDFADTVARAARAWLGDEVDPSVLDAVVEEALDFPVPLSEPVEGVRILELFHGPTLAFKDVGARFMARAMDRLDPDPGRERTVLVATSGDTGGAVAAAFHGLERFRVVVLYPRGRVSDRQRLQFASLGGNVEAFAVEGSFDDCQALARNAFADPGLRRRTGLTSANSINVGRLVPQAFYYLHAWRVLAGEGVRPGVFCVPSGNLGNLTAGLLAARAGMDARFLAAHNRNDAFPAYLRSGSYRERASIATPSTAMDVGHPSNLERIRRLHDDDAGRIRREVAAESVSDAETVETIRRVHGRTGVVLDPHTAVGWRALERRREDGDAIGRSRPPVLLATAHPAKFPVVVDAATGTSPPVPPALAAVLDRPDLSRPLPPNDDALKEALLSGRSPA